MVECEILGFGARPYDFNGHQGTSYKVSVCLGEYPVKHSEGIVGQGVKYAEYKCSKNIFDSLSVGYRVRLELDDSNSRIKSAYLKTDEGYYIPLV